MRAKTVPHLVFVNPPACPDGTEKSSDSRKEKATSCPPMDIQKVTPDSTHYQPEAAPYGTTQGPTSPIGATGS